MPPLDPWSRDVGEHGSQRRSKAGTALASEEGGVPLCLRKPARLYPSPRTTTVSGASSSSLRRSGPPSDSGRPYQSTKLDSVVSIHSFTATLVHTRKLTEILLNLILLSTTNEQEFFQLYLACTELNACIGLQADFEF